MYRLRQLRHKKLTGGRVAQAIFATSMATTIASCVFFHQWLWSAVEHRFAMHAANVELAVKMKIQSQETALWAGVGLLQSQQIMTSATWEQFVEGLSPDHLQKGVEAFGYAGQIQAGKNSDQFANDAAGKINEETVSQKTQTSSVPQHLTVTRFVTPFTDRDDISVGYDMWSNPAHRDAMIRARDSGKLAVGNSQSNGLAGDQARMMMFVPLYQSDQPVATLSDRRANLRGFVFSPIEGLDFFEPLRMVTAKGIEFEVYDTSADGSTHHIYGTDRTGTKATELAGLDMIVRPVEIGGKNWVLTFTATEAFITQAERFLPLLLGLVGMVISLLLYLATRSLGNEQQRALILARRMSHRLLAEKDKAVIAAETEELLRERFEKACVKLQAKNDDLTRFSSIVAHDLRAPLKRIEGFVEILKEEFEMGMDETETRDVMTRLQRSSSRMRDMIDSFQDYTKYGQPSFSHFPIRLKVLVQSLLDAMGEDLASVHVSLDIDEQLEVYADTKMIETVFSNLIDNAIKFAGSNKTKIRIAANDLADDKVEILVSDDGIGIEPQYHEKVFEMFARLHNEDEYQGTGIGLAVCKKIIEDHGGEISVLPRPGNKTCIRFTIASFLQSKGKVEQALAA